MRRACQIERTFAIERRHQTAAQSIGLVRKSAGNGGRPHMQHSILGRLAERATRAVLSSSPWTTPITSTSTRQRSSTRRWRTTWRASYAKLGIAGRAELPRVLGITNTAIEADRSAD